MHRLYSRGDDKGPFAGRNSGVGVLPQHETYFLTIAAVFKNEAHSIREWCRHYIDEGADHIILIDNNSTDGYVTQIQEFISAGKVTVLLDPTPHNQDGIYRRQLAMYLGTTTWMAILDLDEFLYGRNSSIATYLRGLEDDIGAVRLGWKQFGSSGHLEQPKNIVQSFNQRAVWNNNDINVKTIFQCRLVISLQTHKTDIDHAFRIVSPLQVPVPAGPEVGEIALQQHVLHLNHYQLQSKEWFLRVKLTRGSSTTPTEDMLRDTSYFEIADEAYKGVHDDELSMKKLKASDGKHVPSAED